MTIRDIKVLLSIVDSKINLGLPLKNGKDLFTNLTQYEVVNAVKSYLQKFTPNWNEFDQNGNLVYLKFVQLL